MALRWFGLAIVFALVNVSPARAQVALARAVPAVFTFGDGYDGTGFDMAPTSGHLDSDDIVPILVPVAVPFAGTCVTGECARSRITTTALGLRPGFYAVAGSPLLTQALGLVSPLVGRIGVRIRVHNVDTVTLQALEIRVDWGGRIGDGGLTNDLSVAPTPCFDAGTGTPLARGMGGPISTGMGWVQHRDAFPFAAMAAPGTELCFDLTTSFIGRDLLAIERIEVVSLCGNEVAEMDLGEQCDFGADVPCVCEGCVALGEGDVCSFGGTEAPCMGPRCRGGVCTNEPINEGLPEPLCDDSVPCTIDGCVLGMCGDVGRGPTCCTRVEDCVPLACHSATCNAAGMCEFTLEPSCDAGTEDTGPDAAGTDAAGRDGGRPGLDASGIDASSGNAPVISFAGGSGCICGADRARGSRGWTSLIVLFASVLVWRRRRATP